MDGIRWYLKGLVQRPAPPLSPMFTVPEVTTDDVSLSRVQLAAQRYHLTVSSALSDENVMLIRAWGNGSSASSPGCRSSTPVTTWTWPPPRFRPYRR